MPEPEPDTQKWPDIQPTGTGTGYPVHPYEGWTSDVNKDLTCKAKAKTKDLSFKDKAKDLTIKAKAKDLI